MSTVQRVTPYFVPGIGLVYPTSGGAANSLPIRPPAIVGAVELQPLGASSDSFTVNIPAIAAGATVDVPYTYSPAMFPTSFSLVVGASGIVIADVFFPTLPTGCGLLGYSKSLVFGIGPPVNPGSPSWVLAARQTYQAASVQGAFRFFSPAGCAAQSITVAAYMVMLCKPPIVTS